MLSNVLDRVAFWSLSIVVTFLPIFFVPFSKIPAEASKTLLVVVGLAVSLVAWAAARFADGRVSIPRSKILLGVLGVLFSTLLSAIFSSNKSASFFGAMLDVGTFWFMFAATLLMVLSSFIVQTTKQAKIILSGLLISLFVLFLFQTLRFVTPNALSFGVLGGKTSTLVGSWITYGFMAALSAIISVYLLEFLKLQKIIRILIYIMLVLSLFTIIAVNSMLVWSLFGVFSLVIFIYRVMSITSNDGTQVKNFFPFYAFMSVIIALLFLLSGRFIGNFIPQSLGLANLEISPSVSTTLEVGKDILREYPVFGIGVNRFSEAWAYWKPGIINNTQFWDTAFGSGFGFIPTAAINSGALGVSSWIILIIFLFGGFLHYIAYSLKNNKHTKAVFLFLCAGLFLFVCSFVYSFGIVGIMLAFAFIGIFIGTYYHSKEVGVFEFNFLIDPRYSFFAILSLALMMIGTAGLSFKFIERFASVTYFNGALLSTNAKQAEHFLNKALSLHENDLYFRTYAQVQLANLSLLSQKEDLTTVEKSEIQSSFDQAVNSAVKAINYDPKNYLNHQMLGVVYTTVGRMGVEGSQEKAIEAYQAASKLNPLNPGIKLAVAGEYAALGKNTEARKFAEEALGLAPNYIDALIVLSQIEKASGNTGKAKEYADRAAVLNPNNKALNEYTQKLTPVVNEEKEEKSDSNKKEE